MGAPEFAIARCATRSNYWPLRTSSAFMRSTPVTTAMSDMPVPIIMKALSTCTAADAQPVLAVKDGPVERASADCTSATSHGGPRLLAADVQVHCLGRGDRFRVRVQDPKVAVDIGVDAAPPGENSRVGQVARHDV